MGHCCSVNRGEVVDVDPSATLPPLDEKKPLDDPTPVKERDDAKNGAEVADSLVTEFIPQSQSPELLSVRDPDEGRKDIGAVSEVEDTPVMELLSLPQSPEVSTPAAKLVEGDGLEGLCDEMPQVDATVAFTEWQLVGGGASGDVYSAFDLQGRKVAIKVILVDDAVALSEALIELRALRKLEHPNVVALVGGYRSTDTPFKALLVTNFLAGGKFSNLLLSGALKGANVALACRDVLRGTAYVHAQGLLHCDIKPSNIMYDSNEQCLKLVDFGACLPWHGEPLEAPYAGTVAYSDPASLSGHFSDRSDIFSVGITALEMVGYKVQEPAPIMADAVPEDGSYHNATLPKEIAFVADMCTAGTAPGEFISFLSRCLVSNAANRWPAERLLKDPFLANHALEGQQFSPPDPGRRRILRVKRK